MRRQPLGATQKLGGAGEAAALERLPVGGEPRFGLGADGARIGLEHAGVDCRAEFVVGDVLQDAPPGLGHLGAVRQRRGPPK